MSHKSLTERVGIGASPGLGFVHTGSAISFVLDVADLYKADFTIPLAFDLAAKGLTEERDARIGLRDRIAQTRLLNRIVTDIKNLLAPEGSDLADEDLNQLWDEQLGTVAGGTNWADESDLAINLGLNIVRPTMGEDHIAIIGPEFDTPGPTS
ncbi:hypothetical protein AB0B89_36670 [Sphaerisporangium sp. NPDC049002]|uniref:hypothetical protein n=1 Tax=Sphaerisporangium sp. NPDC049002 TaxID=3155392 RepID=UPI0033D0FC4F